MAPEPPPTEDWAWHDNTIYGLHLRSPDPGRQWWHSELVLDIDHIVGWVRRDDLYLFRMAPATLVFDWVSDLRISVDFTGDPMSSAITEWSINVIEQTPIPSEKGGATYQWRILLNVPTGGEIAFRASGHRLSLRGEPQIVAGGWQGNRPPLILP